VMGIILISAVGVAMVVGALYLMLRINRAHERKIQRLHEDWEASGGTKPWAHGHWPTDFGSGSNFGSGS
jgi:hypothetical protein